MTSFIQCHPGAIFQQLSSIDIFFTPLHFFLLMSRLNNQLRFKESVYSWLHIQHHLPKKTYKLLPLKTINCFLLELRSPPLAIPFQTELYPIPCPTFILLTPPCSQHHCHLALPLWSTAPPDSSTKKNLQTAPHTITPCEININKTCLRKQTKKDTLLFILRHNIMTQIDVSTTP